MSATVYVGGLPDLRPGPGGASRCSVLVDRAAAGAFGMRRLQFLVSVWWVDTGPRNPPPGWSGCDHYTFSGKGTRVDFRGKNANQTMRGGACTSTLAGAPVPPGCAVPCQAI